MPDFVVTNVSNRTVTIQAQALSANGGNYSVPYASTVVWSKDPVLRANLYSGACQLAIFGVKLSVQQAQEFLNAVAAAYIVYTS